jgi:two-component system nitrate/nitrite response regulator NarL
MIKVVIVTEFRFFGESLAHHVDSLPEICIAGIFCKSSGAVFDILGARPDVVLLDCRFEDARWLVGRLRSINRGLEMIALGVPDSAQDIIDCAMAGFSGFLPAGSSLSDLGPIIHSTVRGQLCCSPRISKALFLGLSRLPGESDDGHLPAERRLTDREQQVLTLVARGCSNKEIAQDLSISHSTVKNHVHSILTKLHVPRRADAVSLRRRPVNGGGANGAPPARPALLERQEADPGFL